MPRWSTTDLALYNARMTQIDAQADESEHEVRLERELHKLINNELLRRGIEPVHSRTDRRSTNNVGLPDFLFAYLKVPVAMEVKLPGKPLHPKQVEMRDKMADPTNGWYHVVVRSFDEARRVLEQIEKGIVK